MVVLKETTELIFRPAINCIAHLKRAVFFFNHLMLYKWKNQKLATYCQCW